MAKRIDRARRKKGLEEPTVNLTPLIDVVFSILIMFVVVAPMLELDEVALAEANPNPNAGSSLTDTGPIAIQVHQDNTVWLNKTKVELPSLTALLKREKERHPLSRPQLYHDKRAPFGTYQLIKNAAEAAGFQELDVILKPA